MLGEWEPVYDTYRFVSKGRWGTFFLSFSSIIILVLIFRCFIQYIKKVHAGIRILIISSIIYYLIWTVLALAVNRLSQQKNIFMLLRAMKRVLDVFPEYVLEIYGKGEQQEELEKYAKELNISDNVKFMGQKANVQTYIVNASVFVSSSDFEGMSNSMLEAMAIGLPVVCTDCPIGGARMVIKNNINGILTPVGDDRIFADEIIGLLKNPEKAKRLGKQASELREQLNIKKIAKEWEKLFED